MTTEKVQSAGALVLAEINGVLCVAMSNDSNASPDKGADRWVFPKGHIDPNESQLEAAKREVKEETGLSDFIVLTKLGVIERISIEDSGETVVKQIHMFLGWCTTPHSLIPADRNASAAEWKPITDAANLAPYKEDREAFAEWLAPALTAGPRRTTGRGEQQIRQGVEVLREFAGPPEDHTVRDFGWIGMLSAEPDLAERSSEILRHELGNTE